MEYTKEQEGVYKVAFDAAYSALKGGFWPLDAGKKAAWAEYRKDIPTVGAYMTDKIAKQAVSDAEKKFYSENPTYHIHEDKGRIGRPRKTYFMTFPRVDTERLAFTQNKRSARAFGTLEDLNRYFRTKLQDAPNPYDVKYYLANVTRAKAKAYVVAVYVEDVFRGYIAP